MSKRTNSPTPGVDIVQKTPRTKSYRDPWAAGVEIDATNSEAYDKLKNDFPLAWDSYFGGSGGAPAYSPDNALKLQEAVRFWEYMNVGEFVTQLVTNHAAENDPDKFGTLTDAKEFAENTSSVGVFPTPEGGLKKPASYYDPAAYTENTSTINNEVVFAGTGVNSDRTVNDPRGIFSAGYTTLDEYETTRRVAETPYEWGSEYSVGRNTYGK